MTQLLAISLDNSKGSLLRVLGTIERRGWDILEMDMPCKGANCLRLNIRITSNSHHGGSVDTLCAHLGKLFCVHDIEVNAQSSSIQQIHASFAAGPEREIVQ